MSVQMHRDQREEWPDHSPPGTFDIIQHGTDQFIMFVCPKGNRCGVHIGPQSDSAEPITWAWDGDYDKPTLSPSINCIGGCGWHGFVKNGEMTE